MAKRLDALVLGAGLNALGVVRTLGQAGLRIAVAALDQSGPAFDSRFTSKCIRLTKSDTPPEALARLTGADADRPVLYLTQEIDVENCLTNPESWSSYFRTYFYTPGTARSLLSKATFGEMAVQAGAPVPRTLYIRSSEDLSLIHNLHAPVVVKPVQRDSAADMRGWKADRFEELGDAIDLCEEMLEARTECVVQEWIHGTDQSIYFNLLFIDAKGVLRSSFVGRKVLCWPPGVGGTASCVAAPEAHDELTEISKSFLDSVGFRGLIGVEYKRDSDSGDYFMVEPTVYRTDYQHEISALNGGRFLMDVFDACHGRSVPYTPYYSNAVYWVDTPAAGRARALSTAEPEYGMNARRADAWLRTTDPWPGVRLYFRLAIRPLMRRLRNVSNRIRRLGNA